jgi:hypothetical protein
MPSSLGHVEMRVKFTAGGSDGDREIRKEIHFLT